MAFARAWRPKVDARLSRRGARMGASGSVPDRDAPSVNVERLKRRSDFRAVASGARTSGSAFVLQARSRADKGAIRIGFTVSKQVGNAVERNRVRRRLREIVRASTADAGQSTADAGQLCSGYDYVLIGRRPALTAPFGEMVQELGAALTRIHAQANAKVDVSARRGTGGARIDPLHEAGSPSRPRPQRRRNGKVSQASSRRSASASSAKPPQDPPQER
jgi:ribonuclease P protein component